MTTRFYGYYKYLPAVRRGVIGLSSLIVAGGVILSGGKAVDGLYVRKVVFLAFQADMGKALSDIHDGLKTLHVGQLETRRALLASELFNYEVRAGHLTDLERKRAQDIRDELKQLDQRIEELEKMQQGAR
jgi:hypothetical protein